MCQKMKESLFNGIGRPFFESALIRMQILHSVCFWILEGFYWDSNHLISCIDEKKGKDLKRLWSEQIEKRVKEFVVYCYQILEGKIR